MMCKAISRLLKGITKSVVSQNAEDDMQEFIDKTDVANGTPLNRATLMAIQGFQTANTVFNYDGSITETNSSGHTKTTTFNADGSITEKFVAIKTITKKTTFNADGSISEVIQ